MECNYIGVSDWRYFTVQKWPLSSFQKRSNWGSYVDTDRGSNSDDYTVLDEDVIANDGGADGNAKRDVRETIAKRGF